MNKIVCTARLLSTQMMAAYLGVRDGVQHQRLSLGLRISGCLEVNVVKVVLVESPAAHLVANGLGLEAS